MGCKLTIGLKIEIHEYRIIPKYCRAFAPARWPLGKTSGFLKKDWKIVLIGRGRAVGRICTQVPNILTLC